MREENVIGWVGGGGVVEGGPEGRGVFMAEVVLPGDGYWGDGRYGGFFLLRRVYLST